MKYIVLVGDGMCDYPLDELGGKTPLEVARIPNMNFVAKEGRIGIATTIPEKLAPASDVANLSILGYDPLKYYKGRGPLEAANMGIKLKADEIAFRCNLITVSDDVLADYSAGHISNEEARILIKFLDERLGGEYVRFYPGLSYRHLVIIKGHPELMSVECTPPHNITGQPIIKNLPKGKDSDILINLMQDSRRLLSGHEVNDVRVDLKENPANMIWLWGQGTAPAMPSFYDKFGLRGSVISAVDLIKGIGRIIELDVIDVPGATGYYDTNFQGKAQYAIESLKKRGFVFVHVEAPDEAGHNGDLRAKITAIENFDKLVVGTILETKKLKDFRLLVLSDHATPISVKTHTRDPIFFAIYGKDVVKDEIEAFNETACKSTKLIFDEGYKIMDYFIKGL